MRIRLHPKKAYDGIFLQDTVSKCPSKSVESSRHLSMFLLLCSLFFFLMSPPSRMWHRAIACGNCVPHRVLRSPYRARRRNNSAEVAGIEKAHRSGRSQAGATVEGGAKQCHRSAATMATELYEEDYGDSSVKGGMVEPSRATRQGGVERRCAMEMLSSRCGSTHRDVG
jgi:hypothetical protein